MKDYILTAIEAEKQHISNVCLLENIFEKDTIPQDINVKGNDGCDYRLVLTTPVLHTIWKYTEKHKISDTCGLELYLKRNKNSAGIPFYSWDVAQ